MPEKNRTWEPVETRLLSEFLAVAFPDSRTIQRARVGNISPDLRLPGITPEEERLLGVWRRWVDGIVFEPDRVILIEAAVRPDPGDISQLDLYMHLFPMTPEFYEFRDWPRRGVLVYAIDDPAVRMLAAGRGYTVRIYRPSWVEDYLMRLYPRKRSASYTAL